METTGQVISVDPANRTLVVQSETGSILFEAQDRLSDQLQTLKPGDKVTVRYTQDAGKNRAEGIQKG
jgi:cold shock CspA family protein